LYSIILPPTKNDNGYKLEAVHFGKRGMIFNMKNTAKISDTDTFSTLFQTTVSNARLNLKKLQANIMKDLEKAFKAANYNQLIVGTTNRKDPIRLYKIEKCADLRQLKYGPGFYLILSDCKFDDNPCRCVIQNKYKVIYRGHGSRLRKRIESHLFNNLYQQNKDGTDYPVCMKVEANESGINIDTDDRYNAFEWYVIEHSMSNSSLFERELCEQAFDKVFFRPYASRE
jgi:hypothetical protein